MGHTKKRKFEDRPEIEEEICQLYTSGDWSVDAIGKKFGTQHAVIIRVLDAHGIKRRSRHIVTERGKESLRKLRKEQYRLGLLKIPVLNDEQRLRISKANSGENNTNWRGGRTINSHGYVYIIDPDSVGKNLQGRKRYILEHRSVMEQYLGRKLLKNEHVHHINGIKDDNRIENLQVVLNKMHRGMVECPFCHGEFAVQ